MLVIPLFHNVPVKLLTLDRKLLPDTLRDLENRPQWYSSKLKILRIEVATDGLSAKVFGQKLGTAKLTVTYKLRGQKLQRAVQKVKVTEGPEDRERT